MSSKFETHSAQPQRHQTPQKQLIDSSDSGSGGDAESNHVGGGGTGTTGSPPQIMDLGAIEYPPDEHRLQHPYCLWFSRRAAPNSTTQPFYQLQLIDQVGTVEQWWALYCHTVRLNDIQAPADLALFKKGIQPMWEDAVNSKGGRWVMRFKKGTAARAWENLCMAMLGEQFMAGGEVCGVFVSLRYNDDHLSIWNRTAADTVTVHRIRDALKRLLNLPPSVIMEYKIHNDSLNKTWKPGQQIMKS